MKILVIGSEGFIGKELVSKLRCSNNEILCIDRAIGSEVNDNLQLIDSCDVVYMLAAQTSVFNDNFNEIVEDNIKALVSVVLECNKCNAKLIFTSSSTANDDNRTSMYGMTKKFAEEFIQTYSKNYAIVRLHNVYGKNPRKGTLLWHVINDETLTLWNQGENIRHFTHIDDVVDGLIQLIQVVSNKIVNLACPRSVSVIDFVRESMTYTGEKEVTLKKCERKFDVKSQRIDYKIEMLDLGHPYLTIKDGLGRVFKQ